MKKCFLFLTLFIFFHNAVIAQSDGDDISMGKYRIIHSDLLSEDRTLLIHLPDGYDKSNKEYPVLYMLYGNHTLTYFAEVVSNLNKYGSEAKIPPMILVAVTNTNRYRDLIPFNRDGSKTGIDNFLGFFKTELIPYIENNYRTKEFRALLGPQAGANFAFYSLFREPEVFDAIFITNPFRWNSGRDFMIKTAEEYFKNHKSFNKFIFITHNKSDEYEIQGNLYIDKLTELINNYKTDGFILKKQFLPNNTDWISPIGIKEALLSYFKEYPFPESKEVKTLEDIKNYYNKLSVQYGFKVDVPGHVLVIESDKLASKGKTIEQIEILNYMIEIESQHENAYWRLGDISFRKGELEDAKMYIGKMLDLMENDAGMIKARYDKIVKMINESAAYDLEKNMKLNGLKKAKKRYAEIEKSKSKYFDQTEFNTLGYRLLGKNQIKEALFIFEINTIKFPESANAYDSFAEAYMKDGNNVLAMKYYKKSLDLNPNNDHAKKQVEILQKAH